MPFSIPNKGAGLSNIQSVFFQEYLDVLVAGLSGLDCTISGCAVTAQATPNMTVAVASGSVRSNGVSLSVTGANATIAAASTTDPRLDLIVITSAGAIATRTGTAATAPTPAARVANDVALAVVYVPAADAAIQSNQVVDLRVLDGSNNVGITGGTIKGTTGNVNLKAAAALADAAATLTAAQLANSGIFTITPTIARILTTDTAANIVAALPGYVAGTWFDFTIVNNAAFDVTLAAGTGITLVGKMVTNNVSGTWKARIDSATAITIYRG